TPAQAFWVQAIEVVCAEVAVTSSVSQDVIGNDQEFVGDRNGRAFRSSSRCQPAIQSRQIVVLLGGDGPGPLAQAATQPQASFADLSALALAGALVTARTESRPTRQVLCIRELAHVQSDLG